MKFYPEFLIEALVKSATNGKEISVRFRRILTLIVISAWLVASYFSIIGFIKAREASRDYKVVKMRLDSINSMYPNDKGRFDYVRNELQSQMWEAERNTDGYYYWMYAVLLCLVIPWLVIRITFWIIDAGEEEASINDSDA